MSLLFALDPNQTSALCVFVACLGLFGTAWFGTRRWQPAIHCERHLPATAKVGVTLHYEVVVRNASPRPEYQLELQDHLRDQLPSPAECQRFKSQMARGDNWFDRRVGFLPWLRTLRHMSGGELNPHALNSLASHTTVRVELPFTPLRRGLIHFDCIELRRPDVCNLWRARAVRTCPQTLLVLPRHHPMPALVLTNGLGGTPDRRSAQQRSGGDEFHHLREYRLGDSLRLVHWRATAKRGVRVVREQIEAHQNQLVVVIDTDAAPDAFEALVDAAASVVVAAFTQMPQAVEVEFVEHTSQRRRTPITDQKTALHALAMLSHASPTNTTDRAYLPDLSGTPLVLITAKWSAASANHIAQYRLHHANIVVLLINEEPLATAPAGATHFLVRPTTLAADLAQVHWPVTPFIAGSRRRG